MRRPRRVGLEPRLVSYPTPSKSRDEELKGVSVPILRKEKILKLFIKVFKCPLLLFKDLSIFKPSLDREIDNSGLKDTFYH